MADQEVAGPSLPTSMTAAQAAGVSRYFTGRPCKHGHIGLRVAATGNCVACIPATGKATKLRHPEHAAQRREKLAKAVLRPAAEGEPLPSTAVEALAAGLVHYQSKSPCKRGHVAQRFTRTGNCVACHTQVHSPRWRCDNPDACREQWRSWQARNPDRCAAKAKRWYAKHDGAARLRAWRALNAERHRGHLAKRRAALQAGGAYSAAELRHVLRLQRNRCAYCRINLLRSGYHADHIEPLSRGGRNVIANIQALCPRCNVSKGARDPILFARARGLLI
jgi:5-methylcytosine-specific restriction endonuclease McrA